MTIRPRNVATTAILFVAGAFALAPLSPAIALMYLAKWLHGTTGEVEVMPRKVPERDQLLGTLRVSSATETNAKQADRRSQR